MDNSIQTIVSGSALKRTIFSFTGGYEISATLYFQVLCTTGLLSFSEMCFWFVSHPNHFLFGIKIFSFRWIQSLFLVKIIIELLNLAKKSVFLGSVGINFESNLWQVCLELFRHPSRPVVHHFQSFSFSLPCCYIYPTFSRNTWYASFHTLHCNNMRHNNLTWYFFLFSATKNFRNEFSLKCSFSR